MTAFLLFTATLLAVLTVPFVLILYATEPRAARIQRMRSNGYTWQAIADRYGVKSASTPRRWLITDAALA